MGADSAHVDVSAAIGSIGDSGAHEALGELDRGCHLGMCRLDSGLPRSSPNGQRTGLALCHPWFDSGLRPTGEDLGYR